MNTPTARESPTPVNSAFLARSALPAPIFCATKADMDWLKADGTSMIKPHSFSATPTPAEGITPREFTIAVMARKDMLTSKSWKAMGRPRRNTLPILFLSKTISFLPKEKGSFFFRIISMEITTLSAWAHTVAMAAPAVASPNTPTSRKSPAILNTQAIATVMRGIRESPIPRKILPSTL